MNLAGKFKPRINQQPQTSMQVINKFKPRINEQTQTSKQVINTLINSDANLKYTKPSIHPQTIILNAMN